MKLPKRLLPSPSHYFCLLLCAAVALLSGCSGCKSRDNNDRYISPVPCKTPQERRQLFEKLNFEYATTLKFDKGCEHLAQLKPEDYNRYKGNEKMHDDLTAQYGDKIAQGYVANISIKWISPKVGYGVFLEEEELKKGDFVVEYKGKVCVKSKGKYAWSYPPGKDATLREQKYSLDASVYGNEACLINDGEQPNLETNFVFQGGAWHLIYVVKKERIRKGEQLLVSYGSRYWESREKIKL